MKIWLGNSGHTENKWPGNHDPYCHKENTFPIQTWSSCYTAGTVVLPKGTRITPLLFVLFELSHHFDLSSLKFPPLTLPHHPCHMSFILYVIYFNLLWIKQSDLKSKFDYITS